MNIKHLIAGALLLLTSSSAFAFTNIDMDTEVHGRSTASISNILADKGIEAERIEAWGTVIRVDAVDKSGKNYVVMVSQETFEPISDALVR